MVVQMGLMLPLELFAVENPEVHLHPSLQLKLTGFFLQQAAAGKNVVLETHSDLVVRRVLARSWKRKSHKKKSASVLPA